LQYNTIKRFDILIYDKQSNPFILIEVKSFEIELNHKTIMQIAEYNQILKAPLLLLSNGRKTYCVKISQDGSDMEYLSLFSFKREVNSVF
jgi:hypothetical protein